MVFPISLYFNSLFKIEFDLGSQQFGHDKKYFNHIEQYGNCL